MTGNSRHDRTACLIPLITALLAGCAVTEPTDLDRARVASAIADDPVTPIDAIALELGVSELAVVRAIPTEHARPWNTDAEQAWLAVRGWPVAWVDVPGATFLGRMDHVHVDPEGPTPATTGTLQVTLDWSDVESVWLVQKPVQRGTRRAIVWFDDSGAFVLRVRVPGNDAEAITAFDQLWDAVEP